MAALPQIGSVTKNIKFPVQRIENKAFAERGIHGVIQWDVVHVRDQEIINIFFESSSSGWRQGIWLCTDKGLIVNCQLCPSVELWIDTAPGKIPIECRTESGLLHVYNIWDSGGGPDSQAWTSGMKISDSKRGFSYGCNDVGFDPAFEKLKFRIEREGS